MVKCLRIPVKIHFNQDLCILSFSLLPQCFIFHLEPSLLSILDSQKGNKDLAKELIFVIFILIIDCNLDDIMDVSDVAERKGKILVNNSPKSTYKQNIFCQTGASVLYSVCV